MVAAAPLLVRFLASTLLPRPTPIVTTNEGQVQGNVAYSRGGKEYWQFLSIPYAEPPLGRLKFEPPIPIKPWKHVLHTRRWPTFCLQFETIITQHVLGREDCMFLNVFTPPVKMGSGSSLKPVLVHFHGGGFVFGAATLYGPDYFMDEDLVVVTSNYRLGPFGFLNFEHDPKIDGVHLPRGNMGMKDQLLVLKWVQRNIRRFGGDPNRVTIIGESAGGVSVHLHVLSPKSRGLFQRAISQSASAFSSWGFTTRPKQVAQDFARRLGCPVGNSSALLNCLWNYDPRQMIKLQVSSTDPTKLKDNLSPSVERFLTDDTFLYEHPRDIMKSGNFPKVPYLLGVNSADGALRTGRFEALKYPIPMMKSNWTGMLGNVLLLDYFPDQVADLAKDFYFGRNANLSKIPTQAFLDKLTLMFTDVLSFEPVQRAAKGHAKTGAPTYLFYYDYRPNVFPGIYSAFRAGYVPNSWLPPEATIGLALTKDWVREHIFRRRGAHRYGAVHAEELVQLWNVEGVSRSFTTFDLEFSKRFVKVIGDFARGTENLRFKGVPWPRVVISSNNGTKYSLPYMLLDNSKTPKVISDPAANRIRFWNAVGITSFN